MATTQRATADTAGFVPQFWAQKALDVLRQNIVLAQLVARDTDFTETAWQGKSITIPYPGTFTAQDKVEGTVVTPQTASGGNSVTLTLAKHKIVGFSVEDFTRAQTNADLMQKYIEPSVIALAEQFETDLWTTASGLGAYAPIGTAGTDLAASVVRTGMVNLNKQKAPKADRFLVVSPKDEAALLGDSNLATYWAFSQADSIRNGYTGRLYGMDTYMSQMAPLGYTVAAVTGTYSFNGQTTSSLTAATLTASALQTALAGLSSVGTGNVAVTGPTAGPFSVIFTPAIDGTGTLTASASTVTRAQINLAMHKTGVMFACRQFPEPPAQAGVYTAQAMDPESGLSIRISAQYDINAVAMRCNLDILYGTVALRPSLGQLIAA